jgi:hypothetical protein
VNSPSAGDVCPLEALPSKRAATRAPALRTALIPLPPCGTASALPTGPGRLYWSKCIPGPAAPGIAAGPIRDSEVPLPACRCGPAEPFRPAGRECCMWGVGRCEPWAVETNVLPGWKGVFFPLLSVQYGLYVMKRFLNASIC